MSLAETTIDERIGARIRGLRAGRNLTLEALASLAEVSRAMLSRIERGESSPTAQLLAKVCNGLGITPSELFAEPAVPASPLARRADQPTWRDPETRYLRRNVSPAGTGSRVDIVEVEFPAGASIVIDIQRLSGKDQHIWMLGGTLDLALGAVTFRLETGDCLRMEFDKPIRFHNPTSRPTRYAVIVGHGAMTP